MLLGCKKLAAFEFLLDFDSGAHTVSIVQVLTDGFVALH